MTLFSSLLLLGAGCSPVPSQESSVQTVSPTVTTISDTFYPVSPPPGTVGTIQVWRGSLLGPSETDLWLVSHPAIVPGGRPSIRGAFFERGSTRRGNLVGQSTLPNGFTFSFNWGLEEQDQGYGTSTRIHGANGVDVLQGEVRMGSSTRSFTMYPSPSLPSFALHRVATSTQQDGHESCLFSLEYPELLPPSLFSQFLSPDQAREVINTKIVQSLQSGNSTLAVQAEEFLQDCQSQLVDLKKDNPGALPDDAFYTQTVEPDIVFANPQVVSMLFLQYSYTGGAHGNYGYSAHTFDLTTGHEMLLEDLIQPQQLKTFYQRVSAKLLKNNRDLLFPETVKDVEGFLKDKTTLSLQIQSEQYGHLSNWYLTEQGIVFFYNPYEIAPYTAGVQEVVLPLSAWQDLMKPQAATLLTF